MASNLYSYTPVDSNASEIRIAQINPAENKNDPINCHLIHVSLDDKPSYKALSYTWGKETACIPVTIDGKSAMLTPNLDAALKRLRPKDKPLLIWVDFICIDQSNLVERSAQAAKMRNVYKQAENVCVWLGLADEKSERAWRLIELLVDGSEGAIAAIVSDSSRLENFEALKVLFRRPYWWRIWVVQEVNCGRENGREVEVFCGERSITWRGLLSMSANMESIKEHLVRSVYPNDPTSIFSLMGGGPRGLHLTKFSESHEPQLLELLYSHMSKFSTDPKDKVYALIGVSSSRETFGPTDYTRSIHDAYIHTAWHIISTTKSLDVICASQNDDNIYDLPSWVPDWERRRVHPNHRVIGLHIREAFNAAGDSLAEFSFSNDHKILNAQGFVVDSLKEVSSSFYMEGDHHAESKVIQTLHAFEEWWNLYASCKGTDPAAQEVFRRTFCGGDWHAVYDIHHMKRLQIFCALHRKLLPDIGFTPPPFEDSSVVENEEDQRATVSAANLRMHGKCLAISSSARLNSTILPQNNQ
ncbi:hypothetical protein G7Y89_g3025 [Cudoniella acicularis]|uniref:Heterokaryon incompatibility domain-containing protein n=1 Tax=Cudoniella acicularis TaxID=354080 RepID=A0A8H4RU38_9HELO|nr:hypothetical protein G7Y89_g3025 [Cudoniella acicularis]